jgi:LmbE family N-acetylglucosaminyl deacetylase
MTISKDDTAGSAASRWRGRKPPNPRRYLRKTAIVVVAHPDDEVIGLGTRLHRFRKLRALIHVTDGAPRTGPDATNAGVRSYQQYAALRRRELERAISESGSHPAKLMCLWYPDQQAAYRITLLALRLTSILRHFRPSVVFTHPYEGGHPDHDATCAAVHFASSLLRKQGRQAPEVLEFASYHAGLVRWKTECFLGSDRRAIEFHELSADERNAKQRLFGCYRSQAVILSGFPIRNEPVRRSPSYRFRRAPHSGKLLYERFGWVLSGRRWRQLVRLASCRLKVPL